MIQNIIISIFVISIIILVHELGHYIFARIFKVKVFEFSIGFGFKLFQKQIKGTLYSIRVLPFGGYVRLAGVDKSPDSDKYLASESFNSLRYLKKVVILASGSFANILFGFLILFMMNYVIGIPDGVSNIVDQVYNNTPAQVSGIKEGDTIYSINKKEVTDGSVVIQKIRLSEGAKIDIALKRSSEMINITISPSLDIKAKTYYAGFKLKPIRIKKMTLTKSVKESFSELYSYFILILSAFWGLIIGKISFVQISGPLGIVSLTGEMVNYGLLYLFRFIVILNINLSIINMLPIPALDGGRIMILTVEKLIRKTLKEETVDRIHYFGGLVLMTLLVYITYMDIRKLIIK
ncbi:MAG: RIP metalloprotease RseP [Candidatus Margulisbacteria bacterium GWF2_35_9]|nr:MAG: RIP metalloprotease RseP [Candidatus Margulisbacteria bacterium GWF2_35_9]